MVLFYSKCQYLHCNTNILSCYFNIGICIGISQIYYEVSVSDLISSLPYRWNTNSNTVTVLKFHLYRPLYNNKQALGYLVLFN